MNYHCFSLNYNLQWVAEPWSPIFWSRLILKTHLGIYSLSLLDESSHLFFLSKRFVFHSFCLEIHDHSRIRISLSGFICFYIVLLSVWGITVSCFVIILRLHTFQCQCLHLFLISFVPGAVYHAAWKNSTITTKVIEMSKQLTDWNVKKVKEQLLMWKVEEH